MRNICIFSIFVITFNFYLNSGLVAQNATLQFQSPMGKPIEAVAVQSQTVAATDNEGYLFFWEKSSGSLSMIIRAHDKKITAIDFSNDENFFATSSGEPFIQIWEGATGAKKHTLTLPKPCLALMFSDDSKFLIYATSEGIFEVSLTDITNPQQLHSSTFMKAAVVQDEKKYFAVAEENVIKVIDVEDGKVLASSSSCGNVEKPSFSGDKLAMVCANETAKIFQLKKNELKEIANVPLPGPLEKMNVLPAGDLLLYDHGMNPILWNSSERNFLTQESLPQNLSVLKISADKQQIISGSRNGIVRIEKNPFSNEKENKEEIAEKKDSQLETAKTGMPEKLNNRDVKVHQNLEVASAEIEIFIWDHEHEDGDIVSLNLNGAWILEKYEVVKQKKKLHIKLDQNRDNFIILYAHNVGENPPNTAAISFYDGEKTQELTLKSDLKYSDAVKLNVKK